MRKEHKTYFKLCPQYNEWTNIEIEFLVDESLEYSENDYAPNHILKCECREKNQCTRPRNECPVWKNIKW